MTGVEVVIQSVLQCPPFAKNCSRQKRRSLPVVISSHLVHSADIVPKFIN